MPLVRGQVVALRRKGAGVVWRADKTHVWILPVGGCNGPPNHRAEVRIVDPAEMAAMGISFKYPVIRCQALFKIELARLDSSQPIGSVPNDLLRRFICSVTQEAQDQAAESRMGYMRSGSTTPVVVM
jgi:hypothetical protein